MAPFMPLYRKVIGGKPDIDVDVFRLRGTIAPALEHDSRAKGHRGLQGVANFEKLSHSHGEPADALRKHKCTLQA